jgi:hypothetical protein
LNRSGRIPSSNLAPTKPIDPRRPAVAIIAVSLFPPEIDSLDHPTVLEFRQLLAGMAKDFGGKLTSFAIDRGVVYFGVHDEKVAKDVLEIIAERIPNPPIICADDEDFHKMADEKFRARRPGGGGP